MRRSSTNSNQLSLDLDLDLDATSSGSEESKAGNTASPAAVAPDRVFAGNSVFAETSRNAGRLNAAFIPLEEEEKLRQERVQLLDKKFGGTLSRKDENRLQYVRWSLDRIDDARDGRALDELEGMIDRYERLAEELNDLRNEIERAAGKA